jgi:hypothetical protein
VTVTVVPVDRSPDDLLIEIDRTPACDHRVRDDDVERVWAERVKHYPRSFDGPVLSFDGYEDGVVRTRIDSYKRLAVQPDVATGVCVLSVSGIVRCERPDPAVLIGRRSPSTRIYGNMWELGPSGSVDPPERGSRITGEFVLDQLRAESREEIGAELTPTRSRVTALIIDHVANSCDVTIEVVLPEPLDINVGEGWEYTEAQWIPISGLPAFAEAHADETIAPTLATFDLILP